MRVYQSAVVNTCQSVVVVIMFNGTFFGDSFTESKAVLPAKR